MSDSAPGPSCAYCGRPPTNVSVCADSCLFWSQLRNGYRPTENAIGDCLRVTAPRIAKLEAQLVEANAKAKAAQRALSRHHAARNKSASTDQPMFPDNARIEVG